MRDEAPGTRLDGARRTRQRVVQFIVAVPAFVLLWMGLRGVAADYRFIDEEQRRAAARTAETVAKVVEVHEGLLSLRTRKTGPKGTIEFISASGQIVRFPVFLSPDDKVGTSSRICYDPNDPSNHASCTRSYSGSDRVWSNTPPFVFSLYFLWLSWRLGRPRFQDAS